MDQRAIGVFDSGLGGLTAVKALAQQLPSENIIYFGDTGRVPYGSRSKETIVKYARQDVAFLRSFDLKAIVIACGTVSTTALDLLAAENPIPVWGVVEPAAIAAVSATRSGKIGLIGTEATIRSGRYEVEIAQRMQQASVIARACPLFVPLVEHGRSQSGDIVIETVAREYLEPLKIAGIDTLVLGCTHYPLLTEVIGDIMGPEVTLVDVGAQCAHFVAEELERRNELSHGRQSGSHRFFVSDRIEGFSGLASIFLAEDVAGQVEQVDILQY